MSRIDPTTWLAHVNANHPGAWNHGAIHPARRGWHERHFTDGTHQHWWDGAKWLSAPGGAAHWRQVGDYPAWRRIPARWRVTRIDMERSNRMLRIGFGQHDGRWFARVDLWRWGWRLTR